MDITTLFEQVPYGATRRFDCPWCRGKGTFTITKSQGEIKYNCFKLSCKTSPKGTRFVKLTTKEVINVLSSRNALEARTAVERVFAVPDYWIRGIASKKCFQMLLNTHSLEAYQAGMFKLAYDPRLDRMVYCIQNTEGDIIGGIGRTLKNEKPKAYNYPHSAKQPFTCGKGGTCVLVEDCASACSIARFSDYTGVALLGTECKPEYLFHVIANYKNIIIALDKDATYKSVKLRKLFKCYTDNVIIWHLKKDLKNMNKQEIQELINTNNTPLILI